jgi:Kef-type K+ transport system membrane component KefB
VSYLVHDSLTRFIAQVVVIVVVSRMIALVPRRVAQPLVIAEMIGGIVLGPSLLGWAAPEASAVLFPADSLGVLRLFSHFGLVFFMFLIGLEFDLAHVRRHNLASIAIAQSGILLPFVLGGTLALWMYPQFCSGAVSKAGFVLFVGSAMSVTAFPVLARILAERGLLHTRLGAVAITCAAIDDVTAWCLLAFAICVARHGELLTALLTTGAATGYMALMIGVVRTRLARLSRHASDSGAIPQPLVAFLIVLLLLSSWLTEVIGIHALFGSFLFGGILPRDRGFAQALVRRLEDLVVVVFLPLFFASSGLQTRIGLLANGHDWMVCGLIVIVACAGKLGGCALAARATGFTWRDAGTLGVLMNTRGLMELIVLNIGLELGVISPAVFSMMVIMALVTTCSTAPLLRTVARRARSPQP